MHRKRSHPHTVPPRSVTLAMVCTQGSHHNNSRVFAPLPTGPHSIKAISFLGGYLRWQTEGPSLCVKNLAADAGRECETNKRLWVAESLPREHATKIARRCPLGVLRQWPYTQERSRRQKHPVFPIGAVRRRVTGTAGELQTRTTERAVSEQEEEA